MDTFTAAGAHLVLALYNLGSPHNDQILNSVVGLDVEKLLEICGSSPASRIIDGVIDSDAVAFKYKHKLRLKLLGCYHLLADMRVGSRVAEKIYETSDGYFREKIATSLLAHEDFLAGSPFGKYMSRKVNLSLYRRRKEDWREQTAAEIKNAGLIKTNNIKKGPRVFNGQIASESLQAGQSEDSRGPAPARKRKSRDDKDTDNGGEEGEAKTDTRSRQEKREEKRQRKYQK